MLATQTRNVTVTDNETLPVASGRPMGYTMTHAKLRLHDAVRGPSRTHRLFLGAGRQRLRPAARAGRMAHAPLAGTGSKPAGTQSLRQCARPGCLSRSLERERWGAGVETHKNVRGEIGDGVEYHLMKPTPRR